MSRRAAAALLASLWLAGCGGHSTPAPGPCSVAGVCTSPPLNSCTSATEAVTYPATGVCSVVSQAAACDYPPTSVDCAASGKVCSGGVCVAPGACELTTSGAGWLVYASGSASYDLRVVKALDGACDQPLVTAPGDDIWSAWSATTGKLAWSGTRGGVQKIIVRDALGGTELALDTGPQPASDPAFSPDGATIAYDLATATGGAIYTVPAAGGTPVPLVEHTTANDAAPVFSPDGSHVYFTSNRRCELQGDGSTRCFNDVWRVTTDGVTLERVTSTDVVGRAVLTPDALSLVFARESLTTAGTRIVVRTIAGGAERDLSDQGDSEPTVSADGQYVAFRTTRFGGISVVVVRLDTGALVKRVAAGGAGAPTFPR